MRQLFRSSHLPVQGLTFHLLAADSADHLFLPVVLGKPVFIEIKHQMFPPRTSEVQAGYGLGCLQSEALVAWAIDALAAGYDSPSLRILAGLERPVDTEEVKRLH